MNESVFISREAPTQRSLDYEALRSEGIKFLQQYASDIWTDYNVHDPGITILEYLCYGITDVGYRCNFPVSEFLYSKEGFRQESVNNAFFELQEILPSAPLTPDDYRKMIIDEFLGVKNAWITPLLEHKEGYKGLYAVRIQINEEIETDTDHETIKGKVMGLLAQNRNLCEDFESVYVLGKLELEVSAKVELEMDASEEQVLANILHSIEHFLVPNIHISSLQALSKDGMSIGEILEGPEPKHGIIKTEDLLPLPSVIYASQIMDIINGQAGVRNVENLRLKVEGVGEIGREFAIPPNTFLVLSQSLLSEYSNTDTGESYPITIIRNGKIQPKPKMLMVGQMLKGFAANEYSNYDQRINFSTPLPQTKKDLGEIGAYYSIQRFFPAVYGIGAYGLPRNAGDLRLAQARQLKGFLACMEILFADYLKKLTRIKHLFSIDEKYTSDENHATPEDTDIFDPVQLTALLADIPDFGQLVISTRSNAQFDPYATLLRLKNDSESAIDRRQQFVNHLLARFAENIDENMFCHGFSARQNVEERQRAALDAKCRMLREYPALSRNRGLGMDYNAANHIKESTDGTGNWECTRVSGFKKRICSYLNIERCNDRSLTAFFPFGQHKLEKLNTSEAVKSNTPALLFKTLLKYGTDASYYSIDKIEESPHWRVAFQAPVESHAQGEIINSYPLFEKASTEQEAQTWRDEFVQNLIKFDTESKGFFVVEHILLRPQISDAVQLQIKIKEGDIDVEFVSFGFGDPEVIQNIAEKFLLLAAQEENYEILQNEPSGFFPVIKQANRPILISTGNYGKTEAEAIRKKLIALVTDTLKKGPEKANNWIELKSIPVKGKNLNDFYAHRLSIIFPDWPTCFMGKDAQLGIEHLVAQHIPAHLRADFHWLSRPALVEFEKRYLSWLKAKNQDTMDNKTINDLSFALTSFLSQKAATVSPDNTSAEIPESGLQKTKVQVILAQYPYLILDPEDLQAIEGIGADVEIWLKKNQVYDWMALAKSNPDRLSGYPHPFKIRREEFLERIISWKVQAQEIVKASEKNDWKPFEEYQRNLLKNDPGKEDEPKIVRYTALKKRSMHLS